MGEGRKTLREQLGVHAHRFIGDAPRIIPVSRIVAQLVGGGDEAAISEARNQVLRWLREKSGALPKHARDHQSFEIDTPGRRAAAVRLNTGEVDYWALRHDDIDDQVARVWTTEVTVAAYQGRTTFAVRLVVATREEQPDFEPSVPKLVRYVADSPGLTRNGRRITSRPTIVTDDDGLEDLVNLIQSTDRQRPVFVISLPARSNDPQDAAVDAARLARQCVGAARVFILPHAQTYGFTELTGRKAFSVFDGAVRTYRPGCDLFAGNPFDHPLALRDRIENWEEQHGVPFLTTLLREATQYKPDSEIEDSDVPIFGAVRRAALTLERRNLEENQNQESRDERLRLAESQISQLEQDIENAVALAAGEEQARLKAEEEVRRLNSEKEYLRYHIRQLDEKAEKAGASYTQVEIPIPDSLDELKSWAEEHLEGRIVVTRRAARASKGSPFGNAELAYRAVKALAFEYRDMKRFGGSEMMAKFETALEELGLSNAPSGEEHLLKEKGGRFEVEYRGRQRLLNWHLKNKGNTRDPSRCFRLYYFWDDDTDQVIIGSMPGHLETRLT